MHKKKILVIISGKLFFFKEENAQKLKDSFKNFDLQFCLFPWQEQSKSMLDKFLRVYQPIHLKELKVHNFENDLNKIKFPDLAGNPISVTPITTTTYNFNDITGNNGCSSALSNSITITVNPAINAGNNAFLTLCSDDLTTYALENLIGPGQDTTGYWTTASGSILPNNPNYTFNPQTMPAGNYTYTVEGAPCPPDLATVNISFVNEIMYLGSMVLSHNMPLYSINLANVCVYKHNGSFLKFLCIVPLQSKKLALQSK